MEVVRIVFPFRWVKGQSLCVLNRRFEIDNGKKKESKMFVKFSVSNFNSWISDSNLIKYIYIATLTFNKKYKVRTQKNSLGDVSLAFENFKWNFDQTSFNGIWCIPSKSKNWQ